MAAGDQPGSDFLLPLARLTQHVEAAISGALAGSTLKVEDWRVLDHLGIRRTVPMTDLAQATLITGPTLTRTVERLVSASLMNRTTDLYDRRRVLVSLTSRGLRLRRRLRPVIGDAEKTAFESLGIDVAQFRQIIQGTHLKP